MIIKWMGGVGLFLLSAMVMVFITPDTAAQRIPMQNSPAPLSTRQPPTLTSAMASSSATPMDQLPTVNTANIEATRQALSQFQLTTTRPAYTAQPLCRHIPAHGQYLQPTATQAQDVTTPQIALTLMENMGTESESVTLINNGNRVVNLTGWTLSQRSNLIYTFPERLFFHNAELKLYSRAGTDTPLSAFMGSNTPLWNITEEIILKDAEGHIIDHVVIGDCVESITQTPQHLRPDIVIVDIKDPGGPNESIVIDNRGSFANITGYTLSADERPVFTFGESVFFPGAMITIHTRSGTNTPVQRYWGLSTPVWNNGDIVALKDTYGNVIDTYTIGAEEAS